jgi:hypothetical protein
MSSFRGTIHNKWNLRFTIKILFFVDKQALIAISFKSFNLKRVIKREVLRTCNQNQISNQTQKTPTSLKLQKFKKVVLNPFVFYRWFLSVKLGQVPWKDCVWIWQRLKRSIEHFYFSRLTLFGLQWSADWTFEHLAEKWFISYIGTIYTFARR